MKNLVLTVIAVVVAVAIFALYPFKRSKPLGQRTEIEGREALKALPDKTVNLSFAGQVVSRGEKASAEKMDVAGTVTLTLNAWEHYLLKQKPGMTKYQVDGDALNLKVQMGDASASVAQTSKMTIEIINGELPTKDDYLLLEFSDLIMETDPLSRTRLRIQLHDKSGVALTDGSVPKTIRLAQWNSKTLTVHQHSKTSGANRNDSSGRPAESESSEIDLQSQDDKAFLGQVQDFQFSVL